jgi:group I intron endonuclease
MKWRLLDLVAKLTVGFIRDSLNSEGYKLLDDVYVNNRHRFRCTCPNGHEYETNWFTWGPIGRRCPVCAGNVKPSFDEVKNSFEEEGYTLLSDEYINRHTKLKYKCPNGHIHSVAYYSWKMGTRCPKCRLKRKYKILRNSNTEVDGIIYKVTNTINSKVYIGQTIQSLESRRIDHISMANNNSTTHFHKAIRKYGLENFEWEILCQCESKYEMDDMEFHYIKQFDSISGGYNMTLGGEGSPGRKHTKKSILKISESKKGTPCPEHVKKLTSKRFKGIKKSKEHVSKVVKAKSKFWEITFPDGHTEVVQNLSEFCRENRLNDSAMRMVAKGTRPHHRKFVCVLCENKKSVSYKQVLFNRC